jgi:hypothetical protein
MDFLKKMIAVFHKNVPDTSPPGKINSTDVAKTLRTSAYIGAAATLSYLMTNQEVFGHYGVILTLGGAYVLEFLNKLIKG